MRLDPDDLRLFYKLFPSLLCFVNRREGVTSTPFTTPDDFHNLPVDERLKLRDTLVANRELIDAFVAEDPFDLTEDEREIVRSWIHLVAGEFYIDRCLKKYTIFLTAWEPVVAYGVVSLTDPLEELIGHRLPHLCKAVLLPFKGRIVYDGMLAGYNLHFGPGVRRRLKKSYDAAKQGRGIITSLPPPAVGHDSAPEPPSPGRRAVSSKGKGKGNAKGARPTNAEAARLAHDQIVGLIDTFCHKYLDDEYATLCRKLAGILARKRPSPLIRGKPESWASGIVRVIGWVNFLNDPSQPHSMKMTDIDDRMGVSEATGAAKSASIRKLVKMFPFDPEWTLPGRMKDNPLAWMIEIDGFVLDVRQLPRDVQEEAFRRGLIPYLPEDEDR